MSNELFWQGGEGGATKCQIANIGTAQTHCAFFSPVQRQIWVCNFWRTVECGVLSCLPKFQQVSRPRGSSKGFMGGKKGENFAVLLLQPECAVSHENYYPIASSHSVYRRMTRKTFHKGHLHYLSHLEQMSASLN